MYTQVIDSTFDNMSARVCECVRESEFSLPKLSASCVSISPNAVRLRDGQHSYRVLRPKRNDSIGIREFWKFKK